MDTLGAQGGNDRQAVLLSIAELNNDLKYLTYLPTYTLFSSDKLQLRGNRVGIKVTTNVN